MEQAFCEHRKPVTLGDHSVSHNCLWLPASLGMEWATQGYRCFLRVVKSGQASCFS